MMGKKLNKLCDHMRELCKDCNKQKAKRDKCDIDSIITLQAKINLLENLLQEAAFIKKEYVKELDIDEDVGC